MHQRSFSSGASELSSRIRQPPIISFHWDSLQWVPSQLIVNEFIRYLHHKPVWIEGRIYTLASLHRKTRLIIPEQSYVIELRTEEKNSSKTGNVPYTVVYSKWPRRRSQGKFQLLGRIRRGHISHMDRAEMDPHTETPPSSPASEGDSVKCLGPNSPRPLSMHSPPSNSTPVRTRTSAVPRRPANLVWPSVSLDGTIVNPIFPPEVHRGHMEVDVAERYRFKSNQLEINEHNMRLRQLYRVTVEEGSPFAGLESALYALYHYMFDAVRRDLAPRLDTFPQLCFKQVPADWDVDRSRDSTPDSVTGYAFHPALPGLKGVFPIWTLENKVFPDTGDISSDEERLRERMANTQYLRQITRQARFAFETCPILNHLIVILAAGRYWEARVVSREMSSPPVMGKGFSPAKAKKPPGIMDHKTEGRIQALPTFGPFDVTNYEQSWKALSMLLQIAEAELGFTL